MSGGAGQVLSADAIAALVDAAREGRLPEEAPTQQRRRRMRAVDFTRPTKFTSEQERRLKRGLEAFCRTASTRLSAELRVPLELEVINSTQLTWANAHAQVVPNSITALIDAQPIGTRLMLACEQGLVLGSIELLLGGSELGEVRERKLTDIDFALARHFIDRLCAQLSVIWTDMAELELGVLQLEQHLETAQMIPVSEPTLTFTIEARLNGVSTTVALLLPWSAIGPVAERFGARDEAPDRGAEEIDRVRRAVGGVDMTMRAEVAAIELPIEQVLALQPGDVLPLGAPADGGVTLYADKVPVHRAKPGRSGSRRAVQIVDRVRRPR
jgi:flagellar motor switch protein FliM